MRPTEVSNGLCLKVPDIQISNEAIDFLDNVDRGETDGVSCWRSPQIERHDGSVIDGVGLFATADIVPQTLIAVKQGHVVDKLTVKSQFEVINGSQQQIGDNRFLVGLTPEEVDRNLIGYNHSCDPNAKVLLLPGVELSFLVTRKEVAAGQELTTDYGVSHESDTHIMECKCGSENCRHVIDTRWDWTLPELQERYAGEFPNYIQRGIERRNNATPEEMRHILRHEGTLKAAGCLIMALRWMVQEHDAVTKIVESKPALLRPLFRQIYFVRHSPDLLKGFKMVDDAAYYFAVLCEFSDIEEMGIDRNNRNTIWPNLGPLVEFASALDQNFN